MEKIYMNENQNKRKNVVNGSVILSFAVALFAIISLIAVGFDNVSYAANTTELSSFTFKVSDYRFEITADGATFPVPLYFANDESTPVFCVEHSHGVVDGEAYSKVTTSNGVINDNGLLYILNEYYKDGSNLSGLTTSSTSCGSSSCTDTQIKYANMYVAQAAIWVYLAEKYPSDSTHALTSGQISALKNTSTVPLTDMSVASLSSTVNITLVNTSKISELVTAAKSASSTKSLVVAFSGDSISKVDGSDYYQTPAFTVTSSTAGSSDTFDLTLTGIDGAFVVDENGNKVTALTGISFSGNSKYYVRIPSDKVTTTAQTLTVSATGHFSSLTGSYYVATDTSAVDDSGNTLQKVITVSGTTTDISEGASIEVVGTPDTGMSTAQTVYFIGLIVLLCGVGIVYANAKPAESK